MKTPVLLTMILLLLVAIAHVLRLINGTEVIAGGEVIPMWVSVPGVVVPAGLALWLWKAARKQ